MSDTTQDPTGEDFPPYDETDFEQAEAEMPADAYSPEAADDEAPVDDGGCHA